MGAGLGRAEEGSFGTQRGRGWECGWERGDKQTCGVGPIGKQAAKCLSQGLLQLLGGVPRGACDPAEPCSTHPHLVKLQGNPLCWPGAPQPRKAPCSFSLYWENWCQSCSSHHSWDRGFSPSGEKRQEPHKEPHILEETYTPQGTHSLLFSPLCPFFAGDTRLVTGPQKSGGRTCPTPAWPQHHPGGFVPRCKAPTRPR